MVCMKSIKTSNIQIPKDSLQIQLNNEQFLISFRPSLKDFFTSLERFANIFIFSDLTENTSKMIFPDKKFVYSKDLSSFPHETLIIFDNSSYNWNPIFLVPLFYYTPFKSTSFVFTHISLPNIPIYDHLKFANFCVDAQLKHLTVALENIFFSFIQRKYEKFFIWEYYQYCSTLLEGIQFGVKNYLEKIGQGGYTKCKLNVYFTVAKILGAKIEENCSRQLVEFKNNDQDISGTWLLSCFWSRCVINEFHHN